MLLLLSVRLLNTMRPLKLVNKGLGEGPNFNHMYAVWAKGNLIFVVLGNCLILYINVNTMIFMFPLQET